MPYLLALTLLLAPAYAVRFNLFGLPTNLLMLWVFFVWLVFFLKIAVKNQAQEFSDWIKKIDPKLLLFITLFLISGLISLFWKGFDANKLGQLIVLFLQPLGLFFIAGFASHQNPEKKSLLLIITYLLLMTLGLLALIQYFTLFTLPPAFWGNSIEPKRAIGFFSNPNFLALFLTPLLAFTLPDVFKVINYKLSIINLKPLAWILGALGLVFSLSRGGWLGLAAAILVYLIVAADKKVRLWMLSIVIVIVMVIVIQPVLRERFTKPFAGEYSASSRIELWQMGWNMIKDNIVLGKGLLGFANSFDDYNHNVNLTHHNHPHNIFLSTWVEIGLIGLIGLIGTLIYGLRQGLKKYVIPDPIGNPEPNNTPSSPIRRREGDEVYGIWDDKKIYKLGLALAIIAIITHGLIDTPYYKNDLAAIFWLLFSLAM